MYDFLVVIQGLQYLCLRYVLHIKYYSSMTTKKSQPVLFLDRVAFSNVEFTQPELFSK